MPRSLDTVGVMAGDLDFEVEETVRDELDLWAFPRLPDGAYSGAS